MKRQDMIHTIIVVVVAGLAAAVVISTVIHAVSEWTSDWNTWQWILAGLIVFILLLALLPASLAHFLFWATLCTLVVLLFNAIGLPWWATLIVVLILIGYTQGGRLY